MKRLCTLVVLAILIVSACAPNEDAVQTAIAQTKAAYEGKLATALAGTLAAAVPPTLAPSPTPTPTPTPIPDVPPHLIGINVKPQGGLIVVTFNFTDANGDAQTIHSDVVAKSGRSRVIVSDQTIDNSAEEQRAGANFEFQWSCSGAAWVTIRATIVDSKGNKSNAVIYTIVCR